MRIVNRIIKGYLLTSVFIFPAYAQVTKVTGRIFDAETREPLPFVNILLKGTRTGTTTDVEGNYTISTPENCDSILFMYVGYEKKAMKVNSGITQSLNVLLSPASLSLQEVVVTPGENPALRIFRLLVDNKEKNNRDNLDAYQYEVYNKIEFDLNNLSDEFRNRKLFRSFSFIFDNIDSSGISEKPFLPVFITETLSEYYYRNTPKAKKEIIKASKISGVENNSISQFMGDMYQNVNIYDNAVLVFGKNFISPLSSTGLLFYKYYLIDSVVLDGHRCYQLQFKPRRKQELTFTGNMWVADTSFAVKRIEMSIAEDANINFVNALRVVQDYKPVNGVWMLSKDKLVIDFALRDKKMGVYGRKTTSYKNIVVEQPRDDEFYSLTKDLLVEEEAAHRDEDYWGNARHDTLSKNERMIYKVVDTLQTLPVYKTWVDVITLFISGYKEWENIEQGPYYKTMSFNTVEGFRLRVGGRTSNKFSKWYELSGYLAYGLRDQRFKYSFGYRSFITKDPRQMLGLYYKSDYEVLGQSQNAFTPDNILSSVFRRNPLSKLTNVEQVSSYYEREWFPGLSTRLSFVNRRMTPLGVFRYEYVKNDQTIGMKENLTTSEFIVFTRFAYDEKYVSGEFERASLGTRYPVLQLQYSLGVRGLFNSDYHYQKFSVNVNDRFRINPFGYTDYMLEYGRVFGNVPYPLMELHGGNETYTYDPYAYNMMNYYEFVSEQYGMAAVFHHFDGFFLNKIPLLRKLKWREVVTAKVLAGRVGANNQNIFLFPTTLYTLNAKPYYEAGVGLENIFKIFRVDVLWRLSHLTNPNISKFGVRGSLQIIF